MKILVVEDAAEQRLLVQHLLEEDEYEVGVAADGAEAVRMLADGDWDMVITDLRMPELDGLELTRHCHREFPNLPVVLMTAHGNADIAHEALKSGALFFIPKEKLAEDLVSSVDALADRLRARMERSQALKFMVEGRAEFVIGNDVKFVAPLVSYIESTVGDLLGRRDDPATFQMGMALSEAIMNAIYHGNLGLDSILREGDGKAWFELARQRQASAPWQDRRVRVTVEIGPGEVALTVQDEGDGFDPEALPDPTAEENLFRVHGRGLYLMETFMDAVEFNAKGNRVTLRKRFEDDVAEAGASTA